MPIYASFIEKDTAIQEAGGSYKGTVLQIDVESSSGTTLDFIACALKLTTPIKLGDIK